MLTLSDVTMRFGAQILFEDVSWQLHPGERTGLVGANGTGKSTLLKLMAGQMAPESGIIQRSGDLRLGVLGQDQAQFDAMAVLDVVLMGRPRLWSALHEKARLLERVGGGGEGPGNGHGSDTVLGDADGHRLAELEQVIGENDGYEAEAQAAASGGPAGFRETPGAPNLERAPPVRFLRLSNLMGGVGRQAGVPGRARARPERAAPAGWLASARSSLCREDNAGGERRTRRPCPDSSTSGNRTVAPGTPRQGSS